MTFSLVFLAVAAGVMLLAAVKNSAKVRQVLNQHSGKTRYLPQAISMLVLTAQVSEMMRVVEHVSVVNVVAALFLLAIAVAAKSGTESELR